MSIKKKSEYDNGRLLRLLLKLGTLNERPDQGGGTGEWAETGERYILKLFRDYLFHQVRLGSARRGVARRGVVTRRVLFWLFVLIVCN